MKRPSKEIETYDYIIVGAGSSGCVIANRLSENTGNRVLLLEAGGDDRSWRIRMPSAVAVVLDNPKIVWRYQTESEPGMRGRVIDQPRGRVIGGTSSINGMMYVRGNSSDFDSWREMGCVGWGYDEVLPYFQRSEKFEGGPDAYRGGNGPLVVTRGSADEPLHKAFIEAGLQAGHALTSDFNGARQEGVGLMDRTTRGGIRASSADAYLRSAKMRNNLRVLTRATVQRVEMNGNRAVGVKFREDSGIERVVHARREIILAAGAFASPQLLILSGIGPVDELQKFGIPVIRDCPGVGMNLHDHPDVIVKQATTRAVGLHALVSSPLRRALIGARWLLSHQGPGATNHFEVGAFLRSSPLMRAPDLQLSFLALALAPGNVQGSQSIGMHGFQTHIDLLQPESRGWLRLRSPDPRDPPLLQFNYLSSDADLRRLREGIRLTRAIHSQSALQYFAGSELSPGEELVTDAELDDWIICNANTAYHPVGTCRMGSSSDKMTVVSPACKVVGTVGLRVADASIMPVIVSGNTNAATIMIGEHASDLILADNFGLGALS